MMDYRKEFRRAHPWVFWSLVAVNIVLPALAIPLLLWGIFDSVVLLLR